MEYIFRYYLLVLVALVISSTEVSDIQYAQELLSTFLSSIGEVALQPTTGGRFVITLIHSSNADFANERICLWDRKIEGGFPGDPFENLSYLEQEN